MGNKVLLAMSGGVDSSAAAIILKKQGYQVIGITMKLKQQDQVIVKEAKKVCEQLNIPHHVIECNEIFEKNVITPFICDYQRAETPNPCIECNKYLKFGLLYEQAKKMGCDYLATGHYAKTDYSEKYHTYVIKKSNSIKKDQSYVLYSIPKEKIPHLLFPLGEFEEKEQIRQIVKEHNLEIYSKKESQEICFIPGNDYGTFLESKIKQKILPGNIVDKNGNVLGKHRGIIHYTIGQRKGLGISSKAPLYILGINKEKNEIIIGEEKDIYQKELYATNLNFLLPLNEQKEIMAKIRYSTKEAKCKVEQKGNIARIEFEEPQRAITPGQSIVFYDKDILVGGGKIIRNPYRNK